MKSNYYEITFEGADYTSIREVKIRNGGAINKLDGMILELNREHYLYILDKFLKNLNQNNMKDLVINTSKKNINNLKIYSPDYKEGYFAGIVGVLRGQISIRREELIQVINNEQIDLVHDKYYFEIKLQIKSRLDSEKPFFLATLLMRSDIKLNPNFISSNFDDLYHFLLLFWFKNQLQKAYLKGHFRSYKRFERNDDRLKGNININNHIKLNIGNLNGKISYSYREYSINNEFNQLIVLSYNYLKKNYHEMVVEYFDSNIELKKSIDYLKNLIGNIGQSHQKLITKNLKLISQPYYSEYEELRKICIMILRDEGISIFDGILDDEIQGILFYIPDLWELYLEDIIKKKISLSNIAVNGQEEIKVFGYLEQKNKWNFKQKTYPDFIFKNSNNIPFMILDAKFKPKWEDIFKRKAISSVLEDYDKCIRDMVSLNVNATGVIFPTNKIEFDENIIEHAISTVNTVDRFYTLPVYIPETTGEYKMWKKEFEKSITNMLNILEPELFIENS